MFNLDSLQRDFFNWETALSLGLASELVYQSQANVEHIGQKVWNLDVCRFLEHRDTECFVGSNDQAILVAFRGTESLNDWISNLTLLATDTFYGQVHGGFHTAFELIRPQLEPLLKSLSPQKKGVHFTGHSLGGAIASIAACEWRKLFPIAGIYTFGQPRFGDWATVNYFQTHYPQAFHRFVFDDDIVPRIPPGYRHVGDLFHFNGHGFLARPLGEGDGAVNEFPELTLAEFEQLQATAQAIQTAAEATAPFSSESTADLADRSLEGLIPSTRDHRMANYLFAIRNQLPRNMAGVNESTVYEPLEMFNDALYSKSSLSLIEKDMRQKLFPVQVRARRPDWVPPAGVVIQSQTGPYFSLMATPGNIASMQHDDEIGGLTLSREIPPDAALESSASVAFVGGDTIHTQENEQGDAAIVAIVDNGIDILHETFLAAGTTDSRIEAVWVQSDQTGPTPLAYNPNLYTQNYGTLYDAVAIQRFVNDDLVIGNRNTPQSLRDAAPTGAGGHGTHVASIAAGRAVGVFGGGMAPAARIVAVIPHMKTTPPDPPSLGYSSSHQDALAFLLAYKRHRELPMVVNVSQGMNAGAHDGMTVLEKVFDSITNKGDEPGFVIVKSAGNERGFGGHVQQYASTIGPVTIEWDSAKLHRTDDYLEFWYDEGDELEFQLTDPSGNSSPVVGHQARSARYASGGNNIYLSLAVYHDGNNDNVLRVNIYPVQERIQEGIWKLKIWGIKLNARHERQRGLVDGWVERSEMRPIRFRNPVDEITLSIPGTADTVISVAATNIPHAAAPFNLADYSSFGPTRKNNGPKPDICAPGDNIPAARSNLPDHTAVVTMSGTSMAAPHVAGAIALVFSARQKACLADPLKKQFNAIQVGGLLKRSSEGYQNIHHKGYGFGRLNAERFFAHSILEQ